MRNVEIEQEIFVVKIDMIEILSSKLLSLLHFFTPKSLSENLEWSINGNRKDLFWDFVSKSAADCTW